MLILICETSQIFVWRNKAFIFLQKSDIDHDDHDDNDDHDDHDARCMMQHDDES